MNIRDRQLADSLFAGAVIAYPTEGVFGLGCLPHDHAAVKRLLAIKQRPAAKGLILIADSRVQLDGWIDETVDLPAADPSRPTTWIVKPGPLAHRGVTGEHDGIAVRLTVNPVARALCRYVGMPITSTSANLSGRPVVRNTYILRRSLGSIVDGIVSGHCGPASGPSEIRVLGTDRQIRKSPA